MQMQQVQCNVCNCRFRMRERKPPNPGAPSPWDDRSTAFTLKRSLNCVEGAADGAEACLSHGRPTSGSPTTYCSRCHTDTCLLTETCSLSIPHRISVLRSHWELFLRGKPTQICLLSCTNHSPSPLFGPGNLFSFLCFLANLDERERITTTVTRQEAIMVPIHGLGGSDLHRRPGCPVDPWSVWGSPGPQVLDGGRL